MPVEGSIEDRTVLINPENERAFTVSVRFRKVESSNVSYVGWDSAKNLYVIFTSGALYCYLGVSRQMAVACAWARSTGEYLNRVVKPRFQAVKIG